MVAGPPKPAPKPGDTDLSVWFECTKAQISSLRKLNPHGLLEWVRDALSAIGCPHFPKDNLELHHDETVHFWWILPKGQRFHGKPNPIIETVRRYFEDDNEVNSHWKRDYSIQRVEVTQSTLPRPPRGPSSEAASPSRQLSRPTPYPIPEQAGLSHFFPCRPPVDSMASTSAGSLKTDAPKFQINAAMSAVLKASFANEVEACHDTVEKAMEKSSSTRSDLDNFEKTIKRQLAQLKHPQPLEATVLAYIKRADEEHLQQLSSLQDLHQEELKKKTEELTSDLSGKDVLLQQQTALRKLDEDIWTEERRIRDSKIEQMEAAHKEELEKLLAHYNRLLDAKDEDRKLLLERQESDFRAHIQQLGVTQREQLRAVDSAHKAELDRIAALHSDQIGAAKIALQSERMARNLAERALDDFKRECKDPFVVPELLEIFQDISRLTSMAVNGA